MSQSESRSACAVSSRSNSAVREAQYLLVFEDFFAD